MLHCEDKTVQFTFKNTGDFSAIVTGSIGDYVAFTTQLKEELKAFNYKKNPFFYKNVIFTNLPMNLHQGDKRTIFDACEEADFRENFLVIEHVALLQGIENQKLIKSTGVIDFGSSKIDISIVRGEKIEKSTSLRLTKDRLDSYCKNKELKLSIEKMIIHDVQQTFKDLPDGSNVIVTGGRLDDFFDSIEKQLPFKWIKIYNNDELIIKGLQNIRHSYMEQGLL